MTTTTTAPPTTIGDTRVAVYDLADPAAGPTLVGETGLFNPLRTGDDYWVMIDSTEIVIHSTTSGKNLEFSIPSSSRVYALPDAVAVVSFNDAFELSEVRVLAPPE